MNAEVLLDAWWLLLAGAGLAGFATLRALLAYRAVRIERHDALRQAMEMRIAYQKEIRRRQKQFQESQKPDYQIVG